MAIYFYLTDTLLVVTRQGAILRLVISIMHISDLHWCMAQTDVLQTKGMALNYPHTD